MAKDNLNYTQVLVNMIERKREVKYIRKKGKYYINFENKEIKVGKVEVYLGSTEFRDGLLHCWKVITRQKKKEE